MTASAWGRGARHCSSSGPLRNEVMAAAVGDVLVEPWALTLHDDHLVLEDISSDLAGVVTRHSPPALGTQLQTPSQGVYR